MSGSKQGAGPAALGGRSAKKLTSVQSCAELISKAKKLGNICAIPFQGLICTKEPENMVVYTSVKLPQPHWWLQPFINYWPPKVRLRVDFHLNLFQHA